MTLQEIEKIYDSIESIKSRCSLPIKIKLSLYSASLKRYKDTIESLKKEVITEDDAAFEKEKIDLLEQYKNDSPLVNIKLNELITNNSIRYNHYEETIKNIEIIYNYECDDVPKIKLSIEDIPDSIEDIPENVMETIFSLIDDSTDI